MISKHSVVSPFKNTGLTPEELFNKLEGYYLNNGLYDDIEWAAFYGNYWVEHMKPLRTVVNRSVEFFVSKLLPDNYTISTDSEALKGAIEQVLTWSNFASQKQLAIRELSLFGNLFWRINIEQNKIYFDILDPRFVTEFKADSRGYIIEIRTDEPITVDGEAFVHTEHWNKDEYSIWEYRNLGKMELDQLPEPIDSGKLSELNIDFVPFVQVKFREVPRNKFGAACVQHALDKIDEANREATRLAEMMFRYNKETLAISANKTDANGKAFAAPLLVNSKGESLIEDDGAVMYLPGMTTVQSLIPNLNYDAFRNLINDMVAELEKDLPELKYYSLQDNQLSGEAIRLLLAGAIDRANEAQDNLIQGLIRIVQIALSIGENRGIFPSTLGNYDAGDFAFSVETPDMFPMSDSAKAAMVKELTLAGLALPTALRLAGFTEEFIALAIEEKSNEITPSLVNSLNAFNSR